jgi:hypothetical protein
MNPGATTLPEYHVQVRVGSVVWLWSHFGEQPGGWLLQTP